jgi:hypothetical protein
MIKWQKGYLVVIIRLQSANDLEAAFSRLHWIVKLIPALRLLQDTASIYVPEFFV